MNYKLFSHLPAKLLWAVALIFPACLSAQTSEVTYGGPRIEYQNHTCRVKKIGPLKGVEKKSYQGMDIWGNYMLSMQNTGYCTAYRLDRKGRPTKIGESFPLASQHELNHANVASFTTRFLSPDDPLPLICITRCNMKPDEQGRDKVAYIEQIDPERGTARLVQTIWLRDPGSKLIGTTAQWVVDRATGYLYAYGNTIGNKSPENKHRIMKFRMPPYEGEQDSLVILTEKDALENYLLEDYCARPISPVVIQGADIMNGLLYLPTGVGDEKRPSILYVWDLRTRTMRNVVNLQEAIPVEMEDCAPYAGTMMVQCQRCLYQIKF